jgi:hypothetical protein
LTGLAIVSLAVLAAGVWAFYWGHSKQIEYQRDAYEHQREYTRSSYAPARDVCFALPFQHQANCIAEATNKARENERAEQDLVAQRITAVWTFLMGSAAIVGMMTLPPGMPWV